MSKPVKNMITEAYVEKFAGLTGGILIDIRGTGSNNNNELRQALGAKNIKITVIKNSLAKAVFDGTELDALGQFIGGSCALAYAVDEDTSAVIIARELAAWAKKLDSLSFRGAVVDGEIFDGEEVISRLSKLPTLEESKENIVQLVLGPAQKIAGIVKTIQEKLEEGEEITKIS